MRHLLKAILAPVIFETCGIIPVVLVILGVINISAGISLRNVLVYQFTPIFFIIATLFFGFSVYSFLRQKNACTLNGLKQNQKPIITTFIALSVLEGFLLLALQFSEKFVYGTSLTHFSSFYGFVIFLLVVLLSFVLAMRFIK